MAAERILVVDDEELNRDLLQQMLEREGYQVAIAANGQEALALLRQETFHVVLTDLKMPGMTGVEAACTLKRLLPSVPILIVTLEITAQLVEQAKSVGIMGAVQKSDTHEMIRGVEALLRKETFFNRDKQGQPI